MLTAKRFFTFALTVVALPLVTVSVLPLVQTNEWWVRIWDFPRVQLFVACAATMVGLALLSRGARSWRWWVLSLLGPATLFQAYRILPYTPLWPQEVVNANAKSSNDCISIMVANVLMGNRNDDGIRQLIEEHRPSIVLIVENDAWWSRQLQDVASTYKQVIDQPQDNTYGMMFLTMLNGENVQIRHLVKDGIPSILAELESPSGNHFTFYGLHPEPPRIGQDTEQRDQELMIVANEVRGRSGQSIIGGDLNDVAWSHTTRLFKRVSRTLDPRRGRGLYATYNADHWLLRWPLDHLFHTPGFTLGQLRVLPHTGSDHFPVLAQFCWAEDAANENAQAEPIKAGDIEEVQEAISGERD